MKKIEFRKLFLLSDEQVRQVFDSCRNLVICGTVFAAAEWELSRIKSITSLIDVFNSLVFAFLILLGIWLFFINQLQVLRRFKDFGVLGVRLAFVGHIYNLVAVTLIASIFMH